MKKESPEGMSRKQWAAKLRKMRNKITVSFEDESDREAIAPALMGQTYKVGEKVSQLSKGRVAYRHKIARALYGLPKGVGFAKQWRDGTGDWAQAVQKELMPAIMAKLLKELPKRRLHPTPEVAKS